MDSEDITHNQEYPLYRLLVRGLPEYLFKGVDGNPRLDIRKIAKTAGYSTQAIYRRFEIKGNHATISNKMARKMITLSEKQTKVPPNFKPLTFSDFEPFLP